MDQILFVLLMMDPNATIQIDCDYNNQHMKMIGQVHRVTTDVQYHVVNDKWAVVTDYTHARAWVADITGDDPVFKKDCSVRRVIHSTKPTK